METPSTPDYTLDMPNKRWTGQVRAWRRALHTYDPPDLQTAFSEAAAKEAAEQQDSMDTGVDGASNKTKSEIQLEEAKADGLPVQFGSSNTHVQKPSPTSVVVASSSNAFEELDQWEDKRNNHTNDDFDDFVSEGGDISEDSDDDLL